MIELQFRPEYSNTGSNTLKQEQTRCWCSFEWSQVGKELYTTRMKLSRLICHVVRHVMSVLTMPSGYVVAARCEAFGFPFASPPWMRASSAASSASPNAGGFKKRFCVTSQYHTVSHSITQYHTESHTHKPTLQIPTSKRIGLRPGRYETTIVVRCWLGCF